jgi:hypothetical protein
MTDKLVTGVKGGRVCVSMVRHTDRAGLEVLATVVMSPEQAFDIGAELIRQAKVCGPPITIDPASSAGA